MAQEGKTAGTNWVRGYYIEVDPRTQKIIKVETPSHDWTDQNLRQDALQIDGMSYAGEDDEAGTEVPAPKVGDPAPNGWDGWRATEK